MSEDVVSVMGATLLGSVETLLEALGGPSPDFVLVETPRRRVLARKVDASRVLLLIASVGVTEAVLRAEGDRLAARILEAAAASESPPAAGASPSSRR